MIVVGGGVTGCEAAWRIAGSGLRTLLITTSLDTLYQLAHDGAELQPEPGTLMEELVGALAPAGGEVSAAELRRAARQRLERLSPLHLLQSTASGLVTAGADVVGVSTWEGIDRRAGQVALCVGSFLRARLSVGSVVEQQGRLSEMAYDDLYLDLRARGFEFGEIELQAPAVRGSLPYTVSSVALAASEAGAAAFELRRLGCLWAAGVCAPRLEPALPGYEAAAAAGKALGEALVQAAAS